MSGLNSHEKAALDRWILRGPPEIAGPGECKVCGVSIEDDENTHENTCAGCQIDALTDELGALRLDYRRVLLALGFPRHRIDMGTVQYEEVVQQGASILDKTGAVPDTSGKQTVEHRELPPLSKEEQERRKPLPPDVLLDAHNETIHRDTGRGRAAKARKTRRASEEE